MAFGAIVGVALGLRLWGLGFGLPELFHPDEPAYVLQALAVGRGLSNGLTFANPPLFKYVLLAEYAVAYAGERMAGAAHSPQEFVDRFRADPSQLYTMARATSAALGALLVVATGVLGGMVAGRRAAVIAAGLCAVAFLLVRDAHFGVDDTLVTLLVTLGLIPCVRIAQGGSRRDYVAAGALAGLAFSAKYDGIVLLAPLLLAHLIHARSSGQRHGAELVFAAIACAVAAVVTFPSLVTEAGRVVGDIYEHLYLSAAGGYDGIDPSGGYTFYARTLAIGLGWPLLLTAIGGMGWSIVRRCKGSLVVAVLPLALLLVLGSQRLYFARFALPALPALIVEASVALEALIAWRTVVGVLAALLVALPTLVDSIRFDQLMTRPDTRTLAREWFQSGGLPPGSTVAVDAPPLGPVLSTQDAQVAVADDWSLFDLTPAEYRERGIDYLVVSSFTSEARALDPTREKRRVAFADELTKHGIVVAQFRPYAGDREPPFDYDNIYAPYSSLDQLERPGPTITVYRLTP
ncbi:MAG TPA: glycosyltransferase family 39 protein [Chloroflexota bacterium]